VTVYNLRFDDGQHWRVPAAEVEAFRDQCLLMVPAVQPFAGRISRCLWFDLLVLSRRYGVTPHDVLQPVVDVEGGEPTSGLKPATQFVRKPLRGLWHKHWFSARFLPANLLASINRRGSMDFVWDIAKEGDLLTEEILAQIAHHVTITAFEERHDAKQITGEWIIFLRRNQQNYYLCLGTHQTGDQRLYEKIIGLCGMDFPELGSWLTEAGDALSV
jgi:hypothetical protein